MTIQMASVGVAAVIGAGGAAVAELNDLPTPLIAGVPFGGGLLPRGSYNINSNGEGQSRVGSDMAPGVFAQFGDDWLISGLNTQFEVEFIQTSTSGDAGTLTGTLNTFLTTTLERIITWQKDAAASGSAFWNGTIEIREIADPANTTGAVVVQIEATVL